MDSNHHPNGSRYIHGSAPEEQQRLALMNRLINERSLQMLGLRGGEKVLDVGCGLGQFARAMARAAGPKGRVVGIERDPNQLAEARRLAAEAGEANLVDFRSGDAFNLPLASDEKRSFDVAFSRFLLEHIPRPLGVVRQMRRGVRSGGRVVLVDDDHDSFCPWPAPEGFAALWRAYVHAYEHAGNDPYIGRRLVALLYDAGMRTLHNNSLFFGGCAGNDTFEAVADNLISVLDGARDAMLSGGLIDAAAFGEAMEDLQQWKRQPASALWYNLCWAEGQVP